MLVTRKCKPQFTITIQSISLKFKKKPTMGNDKSHTCGKSYKINSKINSSPVTSKRTFLGDSESL